MCLNKSRGKRPLGVPWSTAGRLGPGSGPSVLTSGIPLTTPTSPPRQPFCMTSLPATLAASRALRDLPFVSLGRRQAWGEMGHCESGGGCFMLTDGGLGGKSSSSPGPRSLLYISQHDSFVIIEKLTFWPVYPSPHISDYTRASTHLGGMSLNSLSSCGLAHLQCTAVICFPSQSMLIGN